MVLPLPLPLPLPLQATRPRPLPFPLQMQPLKPILHHYFSETSALTQLKSFEVHPHRDYQYPLTLLCSRQCS